MTEPRTFPMRLVTIPYDHEHPEHGPLPPTLALPDGFRWYRFPYPPAPVRWFYRLWSMLPFGWGRSWGWQPGWSDPIIIQPGETIELMLPMSAVTLQDGTKITAKKPS